VKKEVGDDPARQVERIYLIALSRWPNQDEKRIGVEALEHLTKETTADKALAVYCHAIVNSAAFLYVD
jgi:hypothetical protein